MSQFPSGARGLSLGDQHSLERHAGEDGRRDIKIKLVLVSRGRYRGLSIAATILVRRVGMELVTWRGADPNIPIRLRAILIRPAHTSFQALPTLPTLIFTSGALLLSKSNLAVQIPNRSFITETSGTTTRDSQSDPLLDLPRKECTDASLPGLTLSRRAPVAADQTFFFRFQGRRGKATIHTNT